MRTPLLLLAALVGSTVNLPAETPTPGLLEARQGFTTKLVREVSEAAEVEAPDPALFKLVTYESPAGDLPAYVGLDPKPGTKSPAIIWITGGFPAGGCGSFVWEPGSISNDQSASAYRAHGVVMMYPTLRGGAGGIGKQETFFGEVDDILAAREYLATVEYVDPARIYLGGHSTGGTLVLLVAAAGEAFKAVIAFGPVADSVEYGHEYLTFDPNDAREAELRAPITFLQAIRTPTFVIEGDQGNAASFERLQKASTNPRVTFVRIAGADHFGILSPINDLLARKIAATAADQPFTVEPPTLQAAWDTTSDTLREADDLTTMAEIRLEHGAFTAPMRIVYYAWSVDRPAAQAAAQAAKAAGFERAVIEHEEDDDDGTEYYVLNLERQVDLRDLAAVFAASKAAARLAADHALEYASWNRAPDRQ